VKTNQHGTNILLQTQLGRAQNAARKLESFYLRLIAILTRDGNPQVD